VSHALTRVYCNGVLEAEGFPLADVSEHLERPGTVVWVDFCRPDKEQLHDLAGELGLHELAVEDALGPHQRPKLDRYPTHLFLSCHTVRLDIGASRMDETEIDAFINERWLVTVRKNEGFPMDEVLRRWDRSAALAAHGVGLLLYGLLDVVVDTYFDAVVAFDDYYEEVSEGIFADEPMNLAQEHRWFDMHRALVRFHRLVGPMREALSGLMRHDDTVVAEQLFPYFQDVYDHLLRVTESADSLRELVGTIVATNLSLRDYHQNLIVKKVSGWAAIVAVPALITGFYGMNVPYPGFARHWGFVTSMVVMVGASAGLYLLFRFKDWL
jgi:magnesium transporter